MEISAGVAVAMLLVLLSTPSGTGLEETAMLYCTFNWCGTAAWWCAVGGLLVGLAAAGAWVWSTRAHWDPLGGDPHAILSPDPDLQQGQLNMADWNQAAEAGRRNRIAAALTAGAVVLSSAASLLSLTPH